MIVQVSNVLNTDQVARCREVMYRASWIDGRVTAGYQSACGEGQSPVVGE